MLRWLAALLLVVALLAATASVVTGDAAWQKPAAYGLTMALVLASVSYVLPHLVASRLASLAGLVLGVLGTAIVVLVTVQQARGVPSHFNTGTALDASLWRALLGLSFALEAVIVVLAVLALLGLRAEADLRWAVWGGLGMLVVGMMLANAMLLQAADVLRSSPVFAVYPALGRLQGPHVAAVVVLPALLGLTALLRAGPWPVRRRAALVVLALLGWAVVVAALTVGAYMLPPEATDQPSGLVRNVVLAASGIGAVLLGATLITAVIGRLQAR